MIQVFLREIVLFNPSVIAERKNAQGKWISGSYNFYRNPLGFLRTVNVRQASGDSLSKNPDQGSGCISGVWSLTDIPLLLSGLLFLTLLKR